MIPTATLHTPFHIPEGSDYYDYPDPEQTYRAALELVARIDEDLTRGTGHYRTRDGRLLVKLDQVVIAIIAGDLAGVE